MEKRRAPAHASLSTPAPAPRSLPQTPGTARVPLESDIVDEFPARAWSKNVPERACTSDDECGDGFCDRDRCAAIWSWSTYGRKCDANHPCNGRLCIAGRCRSCRHDAECVKDTGDMGRACDGPDNTPKRPERGCGILGFKAGIDPFSERGVSPKVPNRACKADSQCGDGFCDRGRCAVRLWSSYRYGWGCTTSLDCPADSCLRALAGLSSQEPCSAYVCVEGRCRSCTSDAECIKELGGPTCGRFGDPKEPHGRSCGPLDPSAGLMKFPETTPAAP
jgi:hypothetical protein